MMETIVSIFNGSLSLGDLVTSLVSLELYATLLVVLMAFVPLVLAFMLYNVVSGKGDNHKDGFKGRGVIMLVLGGLLSLVLAVFALPMDNVYQKAYLGRPDGNFCPVYERFEDGTFVTRAIQELDEEGKPVFNAEGEPVLKEYAVKARYQIRLQELTIQPDETLQIKLYYPNLWGADSHLCEIDLKTPEGTEWAQRLQEQMDNMMNQQALENMSEMQRQSRRPETQEQTEQMLEQLEAEGAEGARRLEEAQELIESLQQQLEERAQERAEQGEEGEGQGQEGRSGPPGDGMSITLPTTESDVEQLNEQNLETDSQQENSTENPNNNWEQTEGGVDFVADGDDADK